MNEKQKLELNWPDNISIDNNTDWESTIIQNQLIAFVSFHYDQSPVNPCEEWDGFGAIRSLSHRHINNISYEEAVELLSNDYVVALSYFEHGSCKWGVMNTMSNMPDFRWDGVEFAGIWIADKECIASVDIEEKEAKEKGEQFNRHNRFCQMAKEACETYTAWANGHVYGFIVKLYRLQFDEEKNPIEDYDEYDSNYDELWEDSCWGYYGDSELNGHMKETIVDGVQHHINSMKAESKFDLNGEPDYSKMTQDDFVRIMHSLITPQRIPEILSITGIHEILAEYFNNEVLEEWAKEQIK